MLRTTICFASVILCSGIGYFAFAEQTLERIQECPGFLTHTMSPIATSNTTNSILLPVQVGHEKSLFFRGGDQNLTTVQVRAVSGSRPLVGGFFPAGNSGAMMMLSASPKEPQLDLDTSSARAVQWGADRGIVTRVKASNLPKVGSKSVLDIVSFALGNVRFLRDHVVADHGTWVEYGMKPAEINETSELTPSGELIAYRTSLSGKARYTMRIRPLNGAVITTMDTQIASLGGGGLVNAQNKWRILSGADDNVEFEITFTTSEPPRIPVPAEELVVPEYLAKMTLEEKQKLEFLFYEDGAIAGAHAYMTYFGRDPLITAMIAQDAFSPRALKIILAAALDTVNDEGNPAHEAEVSERASYTRLLADPGPRKKFYDDTTIYDYSMIDTQFLIMPVVQLLLKKTSAPEVRAFLTKKSRSPTGRTYSEQLTLNKDRILRITGPFAADPYNYRNLIHLLEGRTTGQWRDSNFGLAGGRYPFDVNTALAPASLEAILNLYQLQLPGWKPDEALTVKRSWDQWRTKPFEFFRVEIPAEEARAKSVAFARSLNVKVTEKDPFHGQPLRFFALSLDAEGRAIPVVHTDISFVLLYTEPPSDILDLLLGDVRRSYADGGLDSPAGQFVANPAFASAKVQAGITMQAYHGSVWSMQQEMLARGMLKQAARPDLSLQSRTQIRKSQLHVWRAVSRNFDWRAVELWSGEVARGVILRSAYGTGKNIVAESCLDQFWSNTKIANFPPEGWDRIPLPKLINFMSWHGEAPWVPEIQTALAH